MESPAANNYGRPRLRLLSEEALAEHNKLPRPRGRTNAILQRYFASLEQASGGSARCVAMDAADSDLKQDMADLVGVIASQLGGAQPAQSRLASVLHRGQAITQWAINQTRQRKLSSAMQCLSKMIEEEENSQRIYLEVGGPQQLLANILTLVGIRNIGSMACCVLALALADFPAGQQLLRDNTVLDSLGAALKASPGLAVQILVLVGNFVDRDSAAQEQICRSGFLRGLLKRAGDMVRRTSEVGADAVEVWSCTLEFAVTASTGCPRAQSLCRKMLREPIERTFSLPPRPSLPPWAIAQPGAALHNGLYKLARTFSLTVPVLLSVSLSHSPLSPSLTLPLFPFLSVSPSPRLPLSASPWPLPSSSPSLYTFVSVVSYIVYLCSSSSLSLSLALARAWCVGCGLLSYIGIVQQTAGLDAPIKNSLLCELCRSALSLVAVIAGDDSQWIVALCPVSVRRGRCRGRQTLGSGASSKVRGGAGARLQCSAAQTGLLRCCGPAGRGPSAHAVRGACLLEPPAAAKC